MHSVVETDRYSQCFYSFSAFTRAFIRDCPATVCREP